MSIHPSIIGLKVKVVEKPCQIWYGRFSKSFKFWKWNNVFFLFSSRPYMLFDREHFLSYLKTETKFLPYDIECFHACNLQCMFSQHSLVSRSVLLPEFFQAQFFDFVCCAKPRHIAQLLCANKGVNLHQILI